MERQAETLARKADLTMIKASEGQSAFLVPSVPTALMSWHLAAFVFVGGAYDPRATAASAAGAIVVLVERAGEHQNTDTPSLVHSRATFPYRK